MESNRIGVLRSGLLGRNVWTVGGFGNAAFAGRRCQIMGRHVATDRADAIAIVTVPIFASIIGRCGATMAQRPLVVELT
jgi:hypothetical protein